VPLPARNWATDPAAGLVETNGSVEAWDSIRELAPSVFAGFDEIEVELQAIVPTEILSLCRSRMAALLGAPIPAEQGQGEKLGRLAEWPSSPLFTPLDRAAIALAEQFVMDVTGIDQSHIDSLLEHLTTEETWALVNALWFSEAMLRLGLVVGVERPVSPAWGRTA
jgi:hypothetical protein